MPMLVLLHTELLGLMMIAGHNTLNPPNIWVWHATQVNGEAMEAAQRILQATYGPVSAGDCQVAWATEPVLDCGIPNKLCLYPKGLEDGAPGPSLAIILICFYMMITHFLPREARIVGSRL